MLAAAVGAFGVAWWLGLYLIARDPAKPILRRTAYGLLGYSLVIACEALIPTVRAADWLPAVRDGLLCVPAVAWTGVLLRLLPDSAAGRDAADVWWRRVLVPVTMLAAAGLVATGGFGGSPAVSVPVAVLALAPLAGGFGWLVASWRGVRPVVGVLLAATLFFGLGVSALVLGAGWLPTWSVLAGIGADLCLLGVVVAAFDAFSEGETLRPDMQRSALTAVVAAVLFGGQIALAMSIARSAVMVSLLLGSVAAAVAVQVLANPLHGLLDRLSFPSAPGLQTERADLRGVADALPRRAATHQLAELPPDEFDRLTRRALSHYGDLARLVTSPLTELPLVAWRLDSATSPEKPMRDHRHAATSPIERATELKALLLESITRLKPPGGGDFGVSDEWRHYNALYFPYVVGLRPYSQRARNAGLGETARQALKWFQTQVPERTLHNWQNAAAKLVADDLRARGFSAPYDRV